MRPSLAALLGLMLAALPATTAGEEAFSITAPTATVKQFVAGKMRIHVHCAAPCDVQAMVKVSSPNARRLGMLSFRNPPAIGSAGVSAHPAGDFDLAVSPTGTDVQAAQGFKLFKTLPVTVVATSGAAQATAKTSLKWPRARPERGGRGDGPFIKGITGPRRVSLRAKFATFHVRIARIPGARLMTALVVTPGLHYTSGAPDPLPDSVADRGGTFAIKVPIRSGRGRSDAVKLAPLAAELAIGLVTKRTGENAIFRFTLMQ